MTALLAGRGYMLPHESLIDGDEEMGPLVEVPAELQQKTFETCMKAFKLDQVRRGIMTPEERKKLLSNVFIVNVRED